VRTSRKQQLASADQPEIPVSAGRQARTETTGTALTLTAPLTPIRPSR